MPTSADTRGLVVCGLGKSWGDRQVLSEISFELPRGVVAGVTGSNGAGKSTLLRCLAGLTAHTGAAQWGERALSDRAVRQRFAYLPQDVALPPTATVAEALALFARLRRTTPSDTNLPDDFVPDGEHPLGKLSGGQQQRVAIAAVFLGRPELLLLDEPDANLDPGGRRALWQAVAGLTAAGSTVLVATPRRHDHPFDRFIELDEGRVLRIPDPRTPAEVLV